MSPSPPCMEPTNFDYPKGLKLVLLMTSVYISMFLVALDKLIITTALSAITNDFSSTSDIGWYGTAYLLTNCAFLLVFGKLYTFLNVKATFLTAVLLIEIGSAICGAAPSSIAFIIGRAIAGLGAGGIQSGVIVIIVYAVPLKKRPLYQSLFGAVYGVSSVLGPLAGGAFTSNVTWRWCFYINLPLGGVVLIFVFFLLRVPNRSSTTDSITELFLKLDPLGLAALLPGVICLCLALQWGGFTYSWSDGRIIALLVVAFILLIAFVLLQIWQPHRATVTPRIFIQRSIGSGFFVSCCLGAHQMLFLYYLPVWFQAIKGDSAIASGIHLLPQVIALVISSIATGVLTTKIGYYTPFLIVGICIAAIGAGLLTILQVDTTIAQWIGYQILYGWGIGGCLQAPNMAAQTVLPRDEVSVGAALMLFAQTLFDAIFVSIGQNVFDSQLANRLAGITDITAQQIESAGATGVLKMIPPHLLSAALEAYNDSLRVCFQVGLVMACVCILGGLGMEWRNVKAEQDIDPSKNPDLEENKSQNGSNDQLSEKKETTE